MIRCGPFYFGIEKDRSEGYTSVAQARLECEKVKADMKYIRFVGLVMLTLLVLRLPDIAAGGSFLRGAKAENPARLGIFSWQKNNASNEALREEMLGVLVSKGITEVYQTLDVKTAPSFIRRARELGIDVYMLAGRPEWGMDSGAKKMRGEVARAARLMEETGKSGLAGLMLDVEPYLTSVYKKNRQNAMDRFTEAMRNTYAYAREMGVPLIICIPHFYDVIGFDEELKELIEEGSDAVAVMNYDKNDEIGQIDREMELSMRAGKRLINIYELQRPGLHDLTERNTYSPDGLPAVWESRDKLSDHFGYEGLSFALHDYTALRELMKGE